MPKQHRDRARQPERQRRQRAGSHAPPVASPSVEALALQRAAEDPAAAAPADLLALQQRIGNRAVTRLTGRPSQPIQASLEVGPAGDAYEREADQLASQVVSQMQAPARPAAEPPPAAPGGQPQPVAAGVTPLAASAPGGLHRAPAAGPVGLAGGPVDASTEAAIQQARGSGSSLPDQVRQPMERAFGADLSPVRVHTDARSDRLNRALGARAFTTGSDVFFKGGEYKPNTTSGQNLIAHELTHVLQQSGVRRALIQRNLGLEVETNKSWQVWTAETQKGAQPTPVPKGTPVVYKDLFQLQAEYAGADLANMELVTNPPGVKDQSEYASMRDGMAAMGQALEKHMGKRRFNASELAGGDPRYDIQPGTGKLSAHLQVTIGVPLASVPALLKNLQGKGETNVNYRGTAARGEKIAANVAQNIVGTEAASPELKGFITLLLQYLLEARGNPSGDKSRATFPKGVFTVMARTDFHRMFHMLPENERNAIAANMDGWIKELLTLPDVEADDRKATLKDTTKTLDKSQPVFSGFYFFDPESNAPAAQHGLSREEWLRNMPERDLMTRQGKLDGETLAPGETDPEKLKAYATKLGSGITTATQDSAKAPFNPVAIPGEVEALTTLIDQLHDLYEGMGALGSKVDVVRYEPKGEQPAEETEAIIVELRKPGGLGEVSSWAGKMNEIYGAMDEAIKWPQGKPGEKTEAPQYTGVLSDKQNKQRDIAKNIGHQVTQLNAFAKKKKMKLAQQKEFVGTYVDAAKNNPKLLSTL